MNIAIDIRAKKQGGVTTVISGFLSEAGGFPSEHDLTFIAYENQIEEFGLKEFETIKAPDNFIVIELFWVFFILPFKLAKRSIHKYCSFKQPVGPISPKLKTYYVVGSIINRFGDEVFPLKFPLNIYWNFLGKFSILRARKIFPCSLHVKNFLNAEWGISKEKLDVIKNGLNSDFLVKRTNSNNRTGGFLLSVGNISDLKDQKRVFHVFETASKLGYQGNLVFAGAINNVYAQELINVVQNSMYANRVSFVGFCEKPKLVELLDNADCLLMLSKTEGFGMSVIEALSRGCPVVCNDIPGLREAGGGEARYISSSASTNEIFQAITESMSTDEAGRNEMIAYARSHSWRIFSNKLFESLQES